MPHAQFRNIGTDRQKVYSNLSKGQLSQRRKVFERRVAHYAAIGRGEPIQLFYTDPKWKEQLVQDTAARRKRRFRSKITQLLRNPLNWQSWRYGLYLLLEKPLFRERAFRKLQRTYKVIATGTPDLNAKYVYLGLHYQPEMTTSPLGEAFVDQYLIAYYLLAAFPEEVYVYIKEHPNQLSGGRPSHYYSLFPASNRIVFVDTAFSSQELQQHCLAVATVVGTVGFEGLWSGKPALVFGHAYYRHAPGVFLIETIEDARRAANEILSDPPVIKNEALLAFMEWLREHLIPANLNGYYAGDSLFPVDPSANANVLVTEILARLHDDR